MQYSCVNDTSEDMTAIKKRFHRGQEKEREREREMKESISNVFALKYIKMDYSLFHVHMLRSAEWIIKSVFRIKKINGNERLPCVLEIH